MSRGKYTDVNSAGVEMLGYTREEILKLSLTDILASEEAARLPLEVGRFAGGATVLSEWKFRRKDGSFFPGEVCGKRLPDGRLQGILRDISERRQAEQALRQSEERFRVALKDSPITVFSQDCELRYTDVQPAAVLATWVHRQDRHRDHRGEEGREPNGSEASGSQEGDRVAGGSRDPQRRQEFTV